MYYNRENAPLERTRFNKIEVGEIFRTSLYKWYVRIEDEVIDEDEEIYENKAVDLQTGKIVAGFDEEDLYYKFTGKAIKFYE